MSDAETVLYGLDDPNITDAVPLFRIYSQKSGPPRTGVRESYTIEALGLCGFGFFVRFI